MFSHCLLSLGLGNYFRSRPVYRPVSASYSSGGGGSPGYTITRPGSVKSPPYSAAPGYTITRPGPATSYSDGQGGSPSHPNGQGGSPPSANGPVVFPSHTNTPDYTITETKSEGSPSYSYGPAGFPSHVPDYTISQSGGSRYGLPALQSSSGSLIPVSSVSSSASRFIGHLLKEGIKEMIH